MIQARMALTLILALLAGYSFGLAQPQPHKIGRPLNCFTQDDAIGES